MQNVGTNGPVICFPQPLISAELHSGSQKPKEKFVGGTLNCDNLKPYNEKAHIDLCFDKCAV
jgi:hypothetical protein